MKKVLFLTLLIAAVSSVFFGAKAYADAKEEAAFRLPLENYLKGHATGEAEYMKKAFYTEGGGKLIFMRDGKYTTVSFDEYISKMPGKPAQDEAKRKRWIEKVDFTGNSGIGILVLDYPTAKIVDYMTLLKVDGEWKIVNKSFHVEPKPEPEKSEK